MQNTYSEPFDIYGTCVKRGLISVSKEFWVGSLGNRVRSKFEEFGPLANFLLYPSKGFSLVAPACLLANLVVCSFFYEQKLRLGKQAHKEFNITQLRMVRTL